MQEAEAWIRPLQNHLPLVRHRTTLAAAWMPQYLQKGWRAALTSSTGKRSYTAILLQLLPRMQHAQAMSNVELLERLHGCHCPHA